MEAPPDGSWNSGPLVNGLPEGFVPVWERRAAGLAVGMANGIVVPSSNSLVRNPAWLPCDR